MYEHREKMEEGDKMSFVLRLNYELWDHFTLVQVRVTADVFTSRGYLANLLHTQNIAYITIITIIVE